MRTAMALIAGAALAAVPASAQDTNTENAALPATTENAAVPATTVPTDNAMGNVGEQAMPVTTAEPAAVPAPAPRRRSQERGFPWGVIGLVGLLGLLGRRRS